MKNNGTGAVDHRQHDTARASRLRRENARSLAFANRERPRPEAGVGIVTGCVACLVALCGIVWAVVRLAVMHR